MDSQFKATLRDLWADNGPTINDWKPEERHALVIAWYEYDERNAKRRKVNRGQAIPDWISDALSELASNAQSRARLIEGLKQLQQGHTLDSIRTIAIEVTAQLVVFPIASLQEELTLLEPDFIAWRNDDRLRGEADSANDAQATH